jgi:signal transduction histidine kinase
LTGHSIASGQPHPDDLPHVLDRFFRGGEPTLRETGGPGLGLALDQQIVRAHGAELTVTSEAGGKTTFPFRVPSGQVASSG